MATSRATRQARTAARRAAVSAKQSGQSATYSRATGTANIGGQAYVPPSTPAAPTGSVANRINSSNPSLATTPSQQAELAATGSFRLAQGQTPSTPSYNAAESLKKSLGVDRFVEQPDGRYVDTTTNKTYRSSQVESYLKRQGSPPGQTQGVTPGTTTPSATEPGEFGQPPATDQTFQGMTTDEIMNKYDETGEPIYLEMLEKVKSSKLAANLQGTEKEEVEKQTSILSGLQGALRGQARDALAIRTKQEEATKNRFDLQQRGLSGQLIGRGAQFRGEQQRAQAQREVQIKQIDEQRRSRSGAVKGLLGDVGLVGGNTAVMQTINADFDAQIRGVNSDFSVSMSDLQGQFQEQTNKILNSILLSEADKQDKIVELDQWYLGEIGKLDQAYSNAELQAARTGIKRANLLDDQKARLEVGLLRSQTGGGTGAGADDIDLNRLEPVIKRVMDGDQAKDYTKLSADEQIAVLNEADKRLAEKHEARQAALAATSKRIPFLNIKGTPAPTATFKGGKTSDTGVTFDVF